MMLREKRQEHDTLQNLHQLHFSKKNFRHILEVLPPHARCKWDHQLIFIPA